MNNENEIQGWYYLHTNKQLIYKPYPDAIQDIRESDLCHSAWFWDGTRQQAWNICVEALSLGANRERVKELADKWGLTDADAEHYAEYCNGVKLGVDGNQCTAVKADFINLHDSPCGFGNTSLEALAHLCEQLGFKGGKMWQDTFENLCKTN